MFRSTSRIWAWTALPAASLVLAACGSTAINANYTPGPSPNATGTAGAASSPSASAHPSPSTATKTGAHQHATHPQPSKSASAPQRATTSPGSTHSGGSGGTTISTTPTCGWQPGAPPTVEVLPCSNLASSQTVTVNARGLHPGWGVIAIECAYKGNATNQDDCDVSDLGGLGALLGGGTQPTSSGTVTLSVPVKKSFSGASGTNFTCSASTPCVIAVTSPQHTTENATAPISFR